jgi:hypothetical protein
MPAEARFLGRAPDNSCPGQPCLGVAGKAAGTRVAGDSDGIRPRAATLRVVVGTAWRIVFLALDAQRGTVEVIMKGAARLRISRFSIEDRPTVLPRRSLFYFEARNFSLILTTDSLTSETRQASVQFGARDGLS